MWNVEPTKEELTQKLNTATRSMEHMNSLLHETEATNAVLMEQITVCTHEHSYGIRRIQFHITLCLLQEDIFKD